MTIQIPTSEPVGPVDLGQLAALANQFFSALPGDADVATPIGDGGGTGVTGLAQRAAPVTPEAPVGTPQSLNLSGPVPSLQQQPSVPASTQSIAPGRAAGVANGVPEAYAAALPLPPAGVPPSPGGSPFYFLGDSGGFPLGLQEQPQPREDRVTAQPFGLPGDVDLKALLGDNPRAVGTPGLVRDANVPASQSQLSTQSYYFLTPDAGSSGFADRTPKLEPSPRYGLDVNAVRRDFPILQERVHGKQLVWFDNAATTQKPSAVIERVSYFYEHENSNIHRAAHELAARATDAYEGAREKVRAFLGARSVDEIVYTRGTTEAINLVAKTWGAQFVGEGDEIVVSHLEHHANIVPWQQLAAANGAKLRVIPVDDSGQVLLEEYKKLLNSRTKIVSVTQVSNALGTVVPVREIVALAHSVGAVALVDGAQSVSHLRVNVQEIDADFFVFSGHKIFGPTGIGVLYGKKDLLDAMPPWQGGGNMIADVTFDRTVFQAPPNKFEAGTGNIADAVGLGAALDYVQRVGLENIARYEHDLLEYATHHLRPIKGVRLIGTAREKASVLSFVLSGYTTEEVGKALNREGIAVRTGHHCAQPILRRFGLETTVRPSLAFYNTCEEVDRFIAVIASLSAARR